MLAMGDVPPPPLRCGMTNVKTKRNSSGCMATRMMNGISSRRST